MAENPSVQGERVRAIQQTERQVAAAGEAPVTTRRARDTADSGDDSRRPEPRPATGRDADSGRRDAPRL